MHSQDRVIAPAYFVPNLSQTATNYAYLHQQARENEAVRLGYEAMLTNDHDSMAAAAVTLAGYASLAASGMAALLWAKVGEGSRAMDTSLPAGSIAEASELNGGYWLHYGRYIVLLERRDFVRAAAELGEARAYARMLRDERRVQLLDFELQEVNVQLGIADPEEISAELLAPMNARRQSWHYGDHYLPARLQRGDYAKAARLAPADHVVYYLARALTGQTIERMGQPDGAEYAVPRAWAAVWNGVRPERTARLGNDVMATYADLAHAAWMASDTLAARHVPRFLGNVPPLRKDQAVIWAVLQLQATVSGAHPDYLLNLPGLAVDALNALDSTGDVLTLLTRVAPEGLALLACAPSTHPDALEIGLAFASNPLLTAPEHLLAAYHGRPWPALPGRRPNAAAVLMGLQQMVETACDEQNLGAECQWRMVTADLWTYLPPAVQLALADSVAHCLSDEIVSKMQA